MPSCQAWGCANTSGKTAVKKHYHKIPEPPKEIQRAERWLHNIGTGHTPQTFKFGSSKVVCSDHFHPNCYEEDKIAKTLGIESKKVALKVGAVPTIFKHKIYDEINMSGETVPLQYSEHIRKREELQQHKEVSLIFDQVGPGGAVSPPSYWTWHLVEGPQNFLFDFQKNEILMKTYEIR